MFHLGYAGDRMPREAKAFERLVVGAKSAHFNVVVCRWTKARARVCAKHGMQIFVDLLASGHHVYKEVEGAKQLCKSLRGVPTVYGNHRAGHPLTAR